MLGQRMGGDWFAPNWELLHTVELANILLFKIFKIIMYLIVKMLLILFSSRLRLGVKQIKNS